MPHIDFNRLWQASAPQDRQRVLRAQPPPPPTDVPRPPAPARSSSGGVLVGDSVSIERWSFPADKVTGLMLAARERRE